MALDKNHLFYNRPEKRELDIRRFVSNIEKFIIESLSELDIKAYKKNNIGKIWTLDKEKS